MSHIYVKDLVKTFRVAERRAGIGGAVAGLVKRRYRTIRALDSVSFSISRGELVGYIGPNGAGKSTTVKILSGILVPDSGVCEVEGRVPWKQRIAHVSRIGVVFGQRTQLWWDLPVIESFDLLRDIYAIPSAKYRSNRDTLIETLKIEGLLNVPVRQLSLGQRMRCDFVAALLHDPQILFLDEPTIGLDALSKLAVRDFIQNLNRESNVTIILTTHNMDDIEVLCERLLVIAAGAVIYDGTISALRSQLRPERRLLIDLEDESDKFEDPDAVLLKRDGHRLHLSVNPNKVSVSDLVRRIMDSHRIRDLYLENPPIEEIIAQLYVQQQEPIQ